MDIENTRRVSFDKTFTRLGFETHVESLSKPYDSTNIFEVLPGKLDVKRHKPAILY